MQAVVTLHAVCSRDMSHFVCISCQHDQEKRKEETAYRQVAVENDLEQLVQVAILRVPLELSDGG